jgi:hypothetical protein
VSESKETTSNHGAQDVKHFNLDTVVEDEGNNLSVGQVNSHSFSQCACSWFFWCIAFPCVPSSCICQEQQGDRYGWSHRFTYSVSKRLFCDCSLRLYKLPSITRRIISSNRQSLANSTTVLFCASLVSAIVHASDFDSHRFLKDRLRTIISYNRICVLDVGQIAVSILFLTPFWLKPNA